MKVKHTAYEHEFKDLISQLEIEVSNGFVNKKTNGDLTIYDYSHKCVMDGHWTPATLVARGLVVNDERIVALPFPKFFNYSETPNTPDLPFKVHEKMDGSMGIIYYYNGWKVNTRGSFDSDQAIWAINYLKEHANLELLDTNVTYLVEIIYPSNQIVVNYKGKSGLWLIGGYDNTTGEELCVDSLFESVGGDDDTVPCVFELAPVTTGKTIKELLDISKTLSKDEEGFVVRYDNGFRVKIKGDEYLKYHRIISGFSERNVCKFMGSSNIPAINGLFGSLPEEFLLDLVMYESKYNILFNEFIYNGAKFIKNNMFITNKEVGLLRKDGLISNDVAVYFFTFRKGNITDYYNDTKLRRGLFKTFFKQQK